MMKRLLSDTVAPLLRLIYPPYCPSCGRQPIAPMRCCLHCLYELEPTNFHLKPTFNPAYFRLLSSEAIKMASAGFFYEKGNILQKLIFKLKYHRLPQVGVTLGRFYGHQLKGSSIVSGDVVILPIPLHRNKERKKGYNHAERIAYGLSKSLNIRLNNDILMRNTYTNSQTRLDAEERQKNVQNAFSVRKSYNKVDSVILVDDIMTTGSTILSAVNALETAGFNDIRVLTLGITRLG